jgi:alpha-tubulin suppressor-like RCC1 family protein
MTLLAAVSWLGCSDGPVIDPCVAAPASCAVTVTITPEVATVVVGVTVQLLATVTDAQGSPIPGRSLTWTSGDPTVVTVDPSGLVTAVAVGTGDVIATSEGASDTAEITVMDFVLSDPAPAAALSAGPWRAPAGTAQEQDAAYISLAPGTVPNGFQATVRRVGDGASVTTAIFEGGFDPVPVAAAPGDLVDVTVRDAGGVIVGELRGPVPGDRPPIVIRTRPLRKKTDVPLNAPMVIVFNEPVDEATLTTASVRLLRGGAPVSGTVSPLLGSATAAVFVPDATLEPNTDYQLVVNHTVEDLDGRPMAGDVVVEFTTGTTSYGSVVAVTVVPDTTILVIGSQIQLTASARDTLGNAIAGSITWTSDDPAVASVSPSGLVTARGEGVARVYADIGGYTGFAAVFVTRALEPVASVEVVPGAPTMPVAGRLELTAVLKDAAGNVLRYRPVAWSSGNAAVAAVGAGAAERNVITGVSAAAVTITATSEGKTGTATVTVVDPGAYVMIDAGFHTCGVTSGGWAFCWGLNDYGQLGDGTLVNALVPTGVINGPIVSQITAPMGRTTCALGAGEVGVQISNAYCWGSNWGGALGVGEVEGPEICSYASPCSRRPVVVSGGLVFASIAAGVSHLCALTSDGAGYCWGSNRVGQLGIGTTTGPQVCGPEGTGFRECSTSPVAVAGGLTFSTLTVGWEHSCGLTAAGAAYCWGNNEYGQLGDETTANKSAPVQVAGGLSFGALSAGGFHTCGLTSEGAAYCWGANPYGGLGDGTTAASSTPVPVSGGFTWASIAAGYGHTCAVTPGGAAYCWGDNGGGLGNGGTANSSAPVAVLGGLTFATVSAGGAGHSCGVTTTGIVYCWGDNSFGQLGNGTRTPSLVPVRVSGQP